jgi:hypothetical protein
MSLKLLAMCWQFWREGAVDLVVESMNRDFWLCIDYKTTLVACCLSSRKVQLQPLPRYLLPYLTTPNRVVRSENTMSKEQGKVTTAQLDKKAPVL